MAEPKVLSEKTGDVKIQYLLYEGSGPALILLHATGFMPWIWHPIARKLSGSFKIIAPYFCDHRSSVPEIGLNWGILAEDFAKLCKNLKIDKPFIVGHSMGGSVATIASGAFGLLPEKMLLIEPIYLPEIIYGMKIGIEDHPLASKSIKRRNWWEDAEDARSYLKSKKLFSSWDDEVLDIYIKYGMKPGETGGLELVCSPRNEATLFMGSRHYNPWPIINNIKCPVTLLEGENSDTRQYVDFQSAAESFPYGSYKMIENTGHLIPMEKPSVIIDLIKKT